MSGDVTEGLDTSCSAGVSNVDGEMKGFRCESTCPLLCGSRCVALEPGGSWWRKKGSKFGVLGLRELRQKLLLRLEGSRLGRLVWRGSGRNMLELWGSRRRVLVFKGSRRKVLEMSGSSRMVLEWGLMLLVTVTSG